jgi:hypothetical protein
MKLSKKRAIWLISFGILSLFLVFEIFSVIFARKAASQAQDMASLFGSFRPGVTSRGDVEKRFLELGLHLEDISCSGDGCTGLYVKISNFPRFTLYDWIAFDYLLAELSIMRPTILAADFYFDHERLQQIILVYAVDGAKIGIDRHFSVALYRGCSKWKMNAANKVKDIEVTAYEDEHSPRSTFADSLDIRCMNRIMGCHTALELWPSAPVATEPWRVPLDMDDGGPCPMSNK